MAAPARVAVIVPAYGLAHLVGEALLSLQRQSLPDWECVVVDDGSPDDVGSTIAPFLTDPRIRFLATENHGVSAARNRAIRETASPLVALLDGDDLFRPDYLEIMVPLLEADPSIRFATSNSQIFGAVARERLFFSANRAVEHGLCGTLADVLDRKFGVHICTTFRRADFDAVGGFDETMTQSEDLDLWVRLLQLGGEARYVDRVLSDYRVRAGSGSSHGGRILQGNITVYEKARKALPEMAQEQALLERLILGQRKLLDFENAIDRIICGDTAQGIAALRRAGPDQVGSAAWRLSFMLWGLFPGCAIWMLRWRRKAHRRGARGWLDVLRRN